MKRQIDIGDAQKIIVRPLEEGDSLEEMTDVLHAAYRPLAERGMRYLATHQDVGITAERVAKGRCFVGMLGGRMIATVTLVGPQKASEQEWYNRPGVAHFQQFGVLPEFQGHGVGRMLMDVVEQEALAMGACELALDTSEHAHDLIALYRRRGYRHVDTQNWDVTNYRSVVLSKTLVHSGNP